MARLRSFLRVSVSLFDAIHVLSVRLVRLAEPAAQGLEGIPRASPGAARHSIRDRRLSGDADRLLPGLSRHRRRPVLVFILGALDGTADHADRADVVLVV